MEEIRLLDEVISELLDNGYALDFEIMKYMLPGIPTRKNITNVNVSEFTIDKIYSCHETEDGPEIIYVFAVSSSKHNIRGIATSISAVENTITFSEVIEKIINCLKEIYRLCF